MLGRDTIYGLGFVLVQGLVEPITIIELMTIIEMRSVGPFGKE